MERVKRLAMGVVAVGVLALVAVAGGYGWAVVKRNQLLDATWAVHASDFPVPFPLTEAELAELRSSRAVPAGDSEPIDPLAGLDLAAFATERAVARGAHLARARACDQCHGEDLGGGVMLEEPFVMVLRGPNLTAGSGSATVGWSVGDWDRAVRHGLDRDGRTLLMPAIEIFHGFSDRELSDLIAYVRSLPPVDRVVERGGLGPMGTALFVTGNLPFGAAAVHDHQAPHLAEPPTDPVAYGQHLSVMCRSCHGPDLLGGSTAQGDPAWGPAANLTPAGVLKDWSYEDFARLLREGRRPDGSETPLPMTDVVKTSKHFDDRELSSLWAYLRSLPPREAPPT